MKNTIAIVLISVALAGIAQAQSYTCEGMGEAKGQSVRLSIVSDKQIKVESDYADLDVSYSPRANTGLVRFEYKNGLEGVTEALVQDKLLSGADKGLLKLQVRGEGFNSDSYYCHP
jgi:hypothetical protein